MIFKEMSADTGGVITQWQWNFGDGIIKDTLGGSINYTYAFPGKYNAALKVTDTNGCTDSVFHNINIFPSPPVDAGNDTFNCAGSKISLQPSGASDYVWQKSADLSCTNCANPIATPLQSAVYYVTGTANGCSASDSVKIKVQTKKTITNQPGSFSICAGDSVMLAVEGADSYSWSPANTLNNSTVNNPLAFPAQTTTYTVIGKDSNNCFSDTASVNVTVHANPLVNITDSVVQVLIGTTYAITATASNDAKNFAWTPPTGLSCYTCLQPVASVAKTITYTLKATNGFGCSTTDNITIIAVCKEESVFLPNAFSPNNDGRNDWFYPRSSADIQVRSFTIFNRWGQMVFQKKDFACNNYMNGWDGKYNNVPQHSDVYVYEIQLQCPGSSNVVTKRGDISLLR